MSAGAPEGAPLTFRDANAPAGAGVLCSIVAVILAVGAKLLLSPNGGRVSSAVGFGVLTSLFLGILIARGKLPGRKGAIACLATLGWLPMIFFGLAFAHEPLVQGSSLHCGNGVMGAIFFGPFFLIPMILVCYLDSLRFVTASCAPVTVKNDAKQGLWVFEADREALGFLEGERGTRDRDIEVADVATSIAPPVGWTAGGVVGAALAALLVVLALRVERRRDRLAGVEGTAKADGWVATADGPPIHVGGIAPGAVVLFLGGGAAASYRDKGTGVVASWQPGTLAQARDALSSRATALYALAMTSGLLCAAPLLLSGLGGSR